MRNTGHEYRRQNAKSSASELSSQGQSPRGPMNVPKIYNLDDPDAPNTISYLYSDPQDRMLEVILNIMLCRCDVTLLLNDYRAMELHASKAIQYSKELNYIPLTARCHYFRGIAFFHQRSFYQACDDFNDAEPAVGKYIRGQELGEWVEKTQECMNMETPISSSTQYLDRELRLAGDTSEGFAHESASNPSEDTSVTSPPYIHNHPAVVNDGYSRPFVKPAQSDTRRYQAQPPHLQMPSSGGTMPLLVNQLARRRSLMAQPPLRKPSSRKTSLSGGFPQANRVSALASEGTPRTPGTPNASSSFDNHIKKTSGRGPQGGSGFDSPIERRYSRNQCRR